MASDNGKRGPDSEATYDFVTKKPCKKNFGLSTKGYKDGRKQTSISNWMRSAPPATAPSTPSRVTAASGVATASDRSGHSPKRAGLEIGVAQYSPITPAQGPNPASQDCAPQSEPQEFEDPNLAVWIGHNNTVLVVEETLSSGEKIRACQESEVESNPILLDNNEYISMAGTTPQQAESISRLLSSPADDQPTSCDSRTEIQNLRDRIAESLSSDWPEVEEFLNSPTELLDDTLFSDQVEKFRLLESSISGWDPAHIVKPSGTPNNLLHLVLNYPTFKTSKPDFGETADGSNVCTQLLLIKGLSVENSFWYEACFRRQIPPTVRHQATATKFWPKQVQNIHTDFSRTCEGLSKKVLVVFGAPNRKDFKSRHTISDFPIHVSDTERVSIGIIRAEEGQIRFAVVFCPHPEWLLHNWSTWASRYFDACINVAAALADVIVKPNYFEDRARSLNWRIRDDTPSKDAQTAMYLEKVNGVRCKPEDLSASLKKFLTSRSISQEQLSAEYYQGNSVTVYAYKLLQAHWPEIKTMRRARLDRERFKRRRQWFSNLPDDAYGDNARAIVLAAQDDEALPEGKILSRGSMFLETGLTYFYRPTRSEIPAIASSHPASTSSIDAKHSLTYPSITSTLACAGSTSANLTVPSLTASVTPTSVSSTTPNSPVLSASSSAVSVAPTLTTSLALSQVTSTSGLNEIPTSSKSKNPLINTAVIRLGQPVSLKCIKCGVPPQRKPIDNCPEFCTMTHVAGRYITRAQVCSSASCQEDWKKEKGRSGRRMMMIPMDSSIPYIRSDQLNELNY